MSFFDGVKKFVDGVTLPSGQVSERKEEIINELKEKKEVAGNPLLLTILNEYKNMEQVEFGIESIPADVDIYREFLIEDKNEVIIAVVKGKKGLLGKYGVKALFTSQALYCLPENEGYRYINDNKVNGNCIQYSDISKYVLCASNNRNHIWLEGYEGKFDVIKKSMVSAVISNNSIEESLIFLFELVQEFEMKHDKTSKVNRNKLCEWLVEKTMDEKLRTGEIASTEEMINSMKHEKEYACKLYSLLLKCAVYSYSDDKISSTIDEMEKRVSEKDIEKILITFEEDVRAFAKNLADINCEYSVTFLHSMGQQFSLASTPETLFNLEIFSEDYEDKIKKRALEIFYTNKYKIGLHARLRKSPTADIDDVVRSMQFFEINEEEK